jgi:uncharacterized protein YqjF (DUF2071 family)
MLEPISVSAPSLAGRRIASQRWSNLLFVHWRIDSALVASLLPEGLVPDEHDGSSWVGLIPFVLDRATLFGSPPVPYFGSFVEVNVRLYAVDRLGRRGVVFRSLEASRLAAVGAAHAAFSLPYFWARTSLTLADPSYEASSARLGGGPRSTVRSTVRATIGGPVESTPLDEFLTARWGMFTRRGGRTLFVPNEHAPWRLRSAVVDELDDELVEAAGLAGVAAQHPDSVRFSNGVTTWFGRPSKDLADG